ncbi:carbohydrate sulfotransferase 11-like [Diadema setosum]|uniref:carbohydrate sulfotransferase 11-like n=1 Tax=Diadema setosum TaxID=31175 RepID=UPI003B3B9DCE
MAQKDLDLPAMIRGTLVASTLFSAWFFLNLRNFSDSTSRGEELDAMSNLAKTIQTKRKNQLRRACRNLGLSPSNGTASLFDDPDKLKHLYVLPKSKAVYCSVPKVGCTNWKRILALINDFDDYIDNQSDPHVFARENFETLGSMSASRAKEVLRTHTKFLFVRNPYSRLLSAFKDKFRPIAKEMYTSEVYEWLLRNAPQIAQRNDTPSLTFEQFLTFYANMTGEKNEHYQDMYRLCLPCHIDYDFIGKYETLETDARNVLRLIHAPAGVGYPNRRKPPTFSSNAARISEAYSKISDQQLRKLSEYSGIIRDSALFGYSSESFMRRINLQSSYD